MMSDNGSTYLSVAEELHSLMQLSEVKKELGKKGVEIYTHEGPLVWGFWERLIGLTKTAIKKVLGRHHVSLSTLETIIVEIETILNNHPLTSVSSDLGDPETSTPTRLLHDCRITCLPHQEVGIDELIHLNYGEAGQLRKRVQLCLVISRRGGVMST